MRTKKYHKTVAMGSSKIKNSKYRHRPTHPLMVSNHHNFTMSSYHVVVTSRTLEKLPFEFSSFYVFQKNDLSASGIWFLYTS